MRTRILRVFLLCLGLSVAGLGQNPTSFKYVAIDVPGSTGTSANGINGNGVIVGTYTTGATGNQSHGFKLSGGHFTKIDVPGATSTFANGIDSNSDIVGGYMTSDNHQHGFLLHKGAFTRIDFPNQQFQAAVGVNDILTIVGDVGGGFGYIWKSGTFHKFALPVTPGGDTVLTGINDSGELVGHVFTLDNNRAFTKKGSDLDYFEPAGSPDDSAQGINNRGDIVGLAREGAYFAANPEAGENTSDRPENTPDRIPIQFPGSIETVPSGVNTSRVIVGSYIDTHNHLHGFLAAPSSAQYSVTIMAPSGNTSTPHGTLSINAAGNVTITADHLMPSSTYKVHFSEWLTGKDFEIGTLSTNAKGNGQTTFHFPKTGAWAGFFFGLTGKDETSPFFDTFAANLNGGEYSATLEKESQVCISLGNCTGGKQDPGSGSISLANRIIHIELKGAPPNTQYALDKCGSGGSSCFFLGNVKTDASGNLTTNFPDDADPGTIISLDRQGAVGFVGGFKIP